MKKRIFAMAIVFLVWTMAGTCFASLNEFRGNWENVDPNTRGITALNINVRGTKVAVHAWGSCTPKDCDWGVVKATAYAPDVSSNLPKTARAITAEFNTNFNTTLLVIRPLRGKMLKVESYTHFKSGNRTDYCNVYKFKPGASSVSIKEDCVGFNPRTASVAEISGRWKIVDGSHWMFDFGSKKAEAEKTLQIIRHYGMTKSCFVGRPKASFQYMLAHNNAPSGGFPGEDCISFNPNTVAVKNVKGRWKIVDGNHYMFDFGHNEAEAKQAFAIIKKYGFTKSCFVGRPHPSFEYMRK